jgi:hypothetical protein
LIEIRPALPGEIPAQKALWQTCFGDDPAFIDLFYRNCTSRLAVMVLLEDGVIRSMAAILPTALALPDGKSGKAGYIYALCTDPASRSKGFVRSLLIELDRYVQAAGYDCVTLVPAEASLHRYFTQQGYEECFSNRMAEVAHAMLPGPGDGAAVPVSPAEYGRIRENILRGQFHIAYDEPSLIFQQAVSRFLGGNLFRFTVNGAEGCAAADYFRPDRVLVRELLIDPKHIAAAAGLLAGALPAGYYHLRSPAFQEGLSGSYVQAFGMIKWYQPGLRGLWCRERQGYLGLGFD